MDLAFRRSLDSYLTRSPGEDDPRCTLCGDYGRVSAEGVCQSCDEQVRAAQPSALATLHEEAQVALANARGALAALHLALEKDPRDRDGDGPVADAAGFAETLYRTVKGLERTAVKLETAMGRVSL